MIRRGFTIVELVITLTIMGILFTLAVVILNASQANGRDSERKGDAEAIATQLEAFYANVDSRVSQSGDAYPGMSRLTDAQIDSTLIEINPKSLRAPGVDVSAPISIVAATNTSEDPISVTPQPTTTTYVYQALYSNGSLCTSPTLAEYNAGECRKYNLYYFQETEGSVKVIRSKHQ